MLTLARCEEVALHALGDLEALPSATSTSEIVNAAGQWLVDANGWFWLQRTGSLNTTASQNYVDLTTLANFRKLYSVAYTDGVGTWLDQCDLGYITKLRASIANTEGRPQYCAISHVIDADGIVSPQLELFPTPSSTVTSGLQLHYAAGWQTPTVAIPIPVALEGLFIELVRIFARSFHEPDKAELDQRLARFVDGPQWLAAVQGDAATQTNYGQIRNSSIEISGDLPSKWMTGTVPDP